MTEVEHRTARGRGPDAAADRAGSRILIRADSQARSLGEGVVERRDPNLWSSILEGYLRAEGQDVDVDNAGVAGLRIGDAWRGYQHDHLVRARFDGVDMVILAVGVNDWWPLARPRWVARAMERARPPTLRAGLDRAYRRARPALVRWSNGRFRPTRPEHARRDLERMVAALQRTHRVALVTPLPVSSPRNPGFDGNTTEAAAMVLAVGRAAGAPVIDTHQLFEPVEWDEISADHVHVNRAGHDVIARAVAEAIKPAPSEGERPGGEGGSPNPPSPRPADVVIRCDLDGLVPRPAGDDRRVARRFVTAVERGLEARGHSDVGVIDGCFRGLDVPYLHQSLLHDPYVRDPIESSALTVLGVAPPRRVTAHAAEAFRWLVSIAEAVTSLVLLIPPCPDGRRAAHRRFAALVRREGRARGVPVLDLSDLVDAGGGPDLDTAAARLAAVVATHLDVEAPGPA